MAVRIEVFSILACCWIFGGAALAQAEDLATINGLRQSVQASEQTPEGRTPEGRTPEGRTPEGRTPEGRTPEGKPLGPGDVVRIVVHDHAELSGDFTLDGGGKILFPLLGQVPLSGLYPEEGESLIRGRLERDLLQEAIVRLEARQYRSQHVTLVGDVGKPGTYAIGDGLRLLDLLTQAGPGSSLEVRITRGAGGSSAPSESEVTQSQPDLRMLRIEIDDLFSGHGPSNIELQAGDLIYLPRNAAQVHILGEVHHPGPFPYASGMSVLKLLALAGGETRRAALKKIVALRREQGEIVEIPLGLADTVEPDDTIRVPRSFW